MEQAKTRFAPLLWLDPPHWSLGGLWSRHPRGQPTSTRVRILLSTTTSHLISLGLRLVGDECVCATAQCAHRVTAHFSLPCLSKAASADPVSMVRQTQDAMPYPTTTGLSHSPMPSASSEQLSSEQSSRMPAGSCPGNACRHLRGATMKSPTHHTPFDCFSHPP